ncbi:MAG: YraN family protein [Bacteroidales bacterium]|nr:YraN family protein [Bacteroidales bacterium]MDD2426091.1 YraN family protein [Bacteroidales bacterium]MDD3990454.1 YraN family protein [Bacteroidales bacterium]
MRAEARGDTGMRAERIAADYLVNMGLILLKRNFRAGHRELDLIMMSSDGKRLHIVEVKSLNEPVCREPYESVNKRKRRFLISAASEYLRENRLNCEVQFDVVSVTFGVRGETIRYIPGAFLP